MIPRLFAFWLAILFVAICARPLAAQPRSICEVIFEARQQYGQTIAPAEAVAILNAAVLQQPYDFALLEAPAGGNGGLHNGGRRVRLDKIVRRVDLQILDVFVDGPDSVPGQPERHGKAGAGCGAAGHAQPSQIVAPVGSLPPPVPPPAPPPTVVTVPPTPTPFSTTQLDELIARQIRTEALAQEAVKEIKEHRENVRMQYYKYTAILAPIVTGLVTWLQTRQPPK